MTHPVPLLYRRARWTELDRVFRRSLAGSAFLGLVFLVLVLLVPVPEILEKELELEEVPERFARLILEKPAPQPVPPAPVVAATPVQTPAPVEKPEPRAAPTPAPAAERSPAPVAPAPPVPPTPPAGSAGRKMAEAEVAANLQAATGAVDDALSGLKASLGSASGSHRPRAVRRARGNVPAARAGSSASGGSAHARAGGSRTPGTGSGLNASLISVEPVPAGGGTGGTGTGGTADAEGGGGGLYGSYRTNASLLAVVRKYAPGIEYCYDNELKRSPGLRGKLVAALTVAASGEVTEVTLVEDTLGSPRLNDCVLSQIREWRFPAIPEGVVTFRTPFVFTPPTE